MATQSGPVEMEIITNPLSPSGFEATVVIFGVPVARAEAETGHEATEKAREQFRTRLAKLFSAEPLD